MVNRNTWPNSAPLRDITLQTLSDLCLRPFKAIQGQIDSIIGLHIYGSLLVSNSNIWPNSAPLQDIRLRNLNDLDFDLSRSYKCLVKIPRSNVTVSLDSPYMVSCWPHVYLSPFNSYGPAKCLLPSFTIRSKLPKIANVPNYPPNDIERFKIKGMPYAYYQYLRVPNFTPFWSTITRFPDNSGLGFLHRLQWWIWNFRKKKSLKSETQNFKFTIVAYGETQNLNYLGNEWS